MISDSHIVPMALMRWASESWVSGFLHQSGIGLTSMVDADPNQRISDLGSRMLHLAAMSPHRPSKEVTSEVIEFLLSKRDADPNIADDYGRTPLTLFITQGVNTWRSDDQYGADILSLFFAHGADANVYFMPDFVHLAGCKQWTLAHHLNDQYHAGGELPLRMREILEPRLDRNLVDSAGRSAARAQLVLDV
jgi:hypothetical protein